MPSRGVGLPAINRTDSRGPLRTAAGTVPNPKHRDVATAADNEQGIGQRPNDGGSSVDFPGRESNGHEDADDTDRSHHVDGPGRVVDRPARHSGHIEGSHEEPVLQTVALPPSCRLCGQPFHLGSRCLAPIPEGPPQSPNSAATGVGPSLEPMRPPVRPLLRTTAQPAGAFLASLGIRLRHLKPGRRSGVPGRRSVCCRLTGILATTAANRSGGGTGPNSAAPAWEGGFCRFQQQRDGTHRGVGAPDNLGREPGSKGSPS
jgi:hypothetical protein